MNVAVITISDTVASGKGQDASGPAVVARCKELNWTVSATHILRHPVARNRCYSRHNAHPQFARQSQRCRRVPRRGRRTSSTLHPDYSRCSPRLADYPSSRQFSSFLIIMTANAPPTVHFDRRHASKPATSSTGYECTYMARGKTRKVSPAAQLSYGELHRDLLIASAEGKFVTAPGSDNKRVVGRPRVFQS